MSKSGPIFGIALVLYGVVTACIQSIVKKSCNKQSFYFWTIGQSSKAWMIQNYIHIALMTYDYQLMIGTDYLNHTPVLLCQRYGTMLCDISFIALVINDGLLQLILSVLLPHRRCYGSVIRRVLVNNCASFFNWKATLYCYRTTLPTTSFVWIGILFNTSF